MLGSGDTSEVTTTPCDKRRIQRPMGGYQPNVIMEAHSPSQAWSVAAPGEEVKKLCII